MTASEAAGRHSADEREVATRGAHQSAPVAEPPHRSGKQLAFREDESPDLGEVREQLRLPKGTLEELVEESRLVVKEPDVRNGASTRLPPGGREQLDVPELLQEAAGSERDRDVPSRRRHRGRPGGPPPARVRLRGTLRPGPTVAKLVDSLRGARRRSALLCAAAHRPRRRARADVPRRGVTRPRPLPPRDRPRGNARTSPPSR